MLLLVFLIIINILQAHGTRNSIKSAKSECSSEIIHIAFSNSEKTYTISLECLDQDIKMDHKAQRIYLNVEAGHRYSAHCSLCDAEKSYCSSELVSALFRGLLSQMFIGFTDFDLDIALR